MKRTPVESSNVAEVGYDNATQVLEVMFKDSGIYHFFGVHPIVHGELMSSESVGSYFQRKIRSRYQFKKLDEKRVSLDEAIEQLTTNQKQLDQDGIMVGVSRQALDEVLQYLKAA
jgi:hypothetical protein